MKRTWGGLLALGVLAVAISVVWWIWARASWRPPAPIKPALPDIASITGFDALQAKSALEKPLLWSSRAPVEEIDAASQAAPESEISQLRLMAVLETGGQRVALLQRPDQSVLKLDSAHPEGDWRLDSFDGLVAVFVSGAGQRVERPLERAGAAPAGRPGAPPGASAPARTGPGASAGGQTPARPAATDSRTGAPSQAAGPNAAPNSYGLHPPRPAPAGSPPSPPPASPPGPSANARAGA